MPKTVVACFILSALVAMSVTACGTPAAPGTSSALTSSPLDDLASIRTNRLNYTDDADLDPEGMEISVLYVHKNGERMSFTGAAVQVTVKLYAYPLKPGEKVPGSDVKEQLVYEGKFTRDRTEETALGTMMTIRIPFGDIPISSAEWYPAPPYLADVIVEVPGGRTFEARWQDCPCGCGI